MYPEMTYQAFLFEFGISVLVPCSGSNVLRCRTKHTYRASFSGIVFARDKEVHCLEVKIGELQPYRR